MDNKIIDDLNKSKQNPSSATNSKYMKASNSKLFGNIQSKTDLMPPGPASFQASPQVNLVRYKSREISLDGDTAQMQDSPVRNDLNPYKNTDESPSN